MSVLPNVRNIKKLPYHEKINVTQNAPTITNHRALHMSSVKTNDGVVFEVPEGFTYLGAHIVGPEAILPTISSTQLRDVLRFQALNESTPTPFHTIKQVRMCTMCVSTGPS
jgi:hypothetical protein